VAKAPDQNGSDGEGRKPGEQRGLDRTLLEKAFTENLKWFLNTPVVLAVNDAH
jgi:hypothetical protein